MMDSETRGLITWVLGTVTSLVILGGLVTRFILLPYLRDHLVNPVDEVRRQVTDNHHANTPPTIPDRIESMHDEVRAIGHVLDGHLVSSDHWLSTLLNRIRRVESAVRYHHPVIDDHGGDGGDGGDP